MSIYSIGQISLYFPTKVIFGVGSLEKMRDEIKKFNIHEVLVIADKNLSDLGVIERVMSYIKDAISNIEFYYVSSEPSVDDFNNVARFVRGRHFDGVIGIGGGSTLDTAKIASIAPTNTDDISSYIGSDKVKYDGIPLILIPTTAGSGSEVTDIAVAKVRYENVEVKRGVMSEYLLPDVVIVDPELTITLPPRLTAITGLDALAHAIEGLTSTRATPLTDSIALTSIALILRYLYKAYTEGNNIEARTSMSMAALLSGLVVGNTGATLGHFIGETIGPIYNIPHGLAVGITLPYVVKFYSKVLAQKMDMLYKIYLDIKSEDVISNLINSLIRLYKSMNIPLSLAELDIPEADLPKLAEITLRYKVRPTTLIKLNREVLLSIYEEMYEGVKQIM
jgi:alcohol dehydrogenase class IV